jgi:AcrR family transcriptional regulator
MAATTVHPPSAPAPVGDGRRARRERNRDAVVDALLELFRDGNLAPSSDEIAERAGLSPRSLFRYFDDVDDLCRTAISRQHERVGSVIALTVRPDMSLSDCVTAVVEQRVQLFDAMGAVGQVLRIRAPFQPLVAAELSRARRLLRGQLEQAFAAELAALSTASATAVLAAADALCSFESYRLMRDDQGLSRAATTRVLVEALHRLLTSAGGSA